MRKQRTILICGASVAGPTLAYWLTRYGFKVTIIERAPELRLGGQNIDIQGAARTVISRMGIEPLIREASTSEEGLRFVGQDGAVKAEFPVGTASNSRGTKELEILRGELAKILYDQTREDVDYIFGDQIKGLQQHATHVTVSFHRGANQDFDIVVAADGVRSKTRKLILAKDATIRPLGLYCAYFAIPRLSSDDNWWRWYIAAGRRAIHLRPDNVGMIRASLWFVSKPAGYEEWTQMDQKTFLCDQFGDAGWEANRVLHAMMQSEDLYFDHISQVYTPDWSNGRAALLGDCAYGPSPLTGMGTTLAIVGAYVLAGELAKHESHEPAFEAYEKRMRPYVDLAQKIPPGVPWLVHPKTSAGIWLLHKIARAASSLILKRGDNGLGSSPADKIDLPDYSSELQNRSE